MLASDEEYFKNVLFYVGKFEKKNKQTRKVIQMAALIKQSDFNF